MLIVNLSIAQQQKNIVNPPAPLEVEEGEYIPVSKDDMAKSPAYKYSIPGFFTTQVNIDEDGNNIVGDAANEPSIAVDPNDPSRIAIGWRQFATINNSYRQELEDGGMKVAGTSIDGRLVEMIEIPSHPWFVACQFHPEFTSTPRYGHPLFSGFVEAALENRNKSVEEAVSA